METREKGEAQNIALLNEVETSDLLSGNSLPSPVIQHVNCWWMKDPNNEEDARRLREAVEDMREIPGIIDIQFGPRVQAAWAGGTEPTFDYAFVVTFDSEESVVNYHPHPLHMKTIEITNEVSEKFYYFYFNSNMPK